MNMNVFISVYFLFAAQLCFGKLVESSKTKSPCVTLRSKDSLAQCLRSQGVVKYDLVAQQLVNLPDYEARITFLEKKFDSIPEMTRVSIARSLSDTNLAAEGFMALWINPDGKQKAFPIGSPPGGDWSIVPGAGAVYHTGAQ